LVQLYVCVFFSSTKSQAQQPEPAGSSRSLSQVLEPKARPPKATADPAAEAARPRAPTPTPQPRPGGRTCSRGREAPGSDPDPNTGREPPDTRRSHSRPRYLKELQPGYPQQPTAPPIPGTTRYHHGKFLFILLFYFIFYLFIFLFVIMIIILLCYYY
jgi:hypothetical protein